MCNRIRARWLDVSALILSLLPWAGIAPGPLAAQALLDNLQFEELAGGLSRPVGVTHAGDGSGRLFVVQQTGQIIIYNGSNILPAPFLDLTPLIGCRGERGLLGLAFHPNFEANGSLFVHYYSVANEVVVARYQVSADPNRADPQSAEILHRVPQPFPNHNAGQMQFGPDGYLYIALGDGGSGGDPGNRAQDLGTLLGKILRIDVDSGDPYAIPPTNPFVNAAGARPEIWSRGLRNPWRFSFDRATGDMFIGDAGQDSWEEISFQPASQGGLNFGWRLREGRHCFNPPSGCNLGSLTEPILEYANVPDSCGGAVIAGYRYRGARYSQLQGVYFYADFCTGRLYAATESGGNWTALGPRQTNFNFTSFGEDEAGEIYFTSLAPGALFRINFSGGPPNSPSINSEGVVSAASFAAAGPLTPGSIVSVFGLNLAAGTQTGPTVPLSTELAGARLLINGTPAPLFFAGPQQMNIQIPWEVQSQTSVNLSVQSAGMNSPAVNVPLASHSPGLFTLAGTGSGQGAILIAGTTSIAAAQGAFPDSRPVVAGETLSIFGTGFGAVSNEPATGAGAPSMALAETISRPVVRIGGAAATVTFSGLAPGFVGLNQVNAILPAGVSTGDAVSVQVEIGGVPSNTVTAAVGEAP